MGRKHQVTHQYEHAEGKARTILCLNANMTICRIHVFCCVFFIHPSSVLHSSLIDVFLLRYPNTWVDRGALCKICFLNMCNLEPISKISEAPLKNI